MPAAYTPPFSLFIRCLFTLLLRRRFTRLIFAAFAITMPPPLMILRLIFTPVLRAFRHGATITPHAIIAATLIRCHMIRHAAHSPLLLICCADAIVISCFRYYAIIADILRYDYFTRCRYAV